MSEADAKTLLLKFIDIAKLHPIVVPPETAAGNNVTAAPVVATESVRLAAVPDTASASAHESTRPAATTAAPALVSAAGHSSVAPFTTTDSLGDSGRWVFAPLALDRYTVYWLEFLLEPCQYFLRSA